MAPFPNRRDSRLEGRALREVCHPLISRRFKETTRCRSEQWELYTAERPAIKIMQQAFALRITQRWLSWVLMVTFRWLKLYNMYKASEICIDLS